MSSSRPPARPSRTAIAAAAVLAVMGAGLVGAQSGSQPPRAVTSPRTAVPQAAQGGQASATPQFPAGTQRPRQAPPPDTAKPAPATQPPVDSMSPQGVPTLADSAQPSVTQTAAAAAMPKAPAAWPVDPATGMTLINGEPVVGRVFIMRKTDGLQKYEGVARHYVGEPLPPERPLAAAPAALRQVEPATLRRHRGSMVQSNLWSIETKRSAMETHHYRATTTADRLPPR